MSHIRHTRIADSSNIDGIIIIAKIFHLFVRECYPGGKILICAIVEFIPFDLCASISYFCKDF